MELCSRPTSDFPPEPVRAQALLSADLVTSELLGAKYETEGSRLLASSTGRDWQNGIGAEIRRHTDLHCQAFLQPVNELAIAIDGRATIQRQAHGPEQKFLAHVGKACLCPRGVDVRYLHVAQGSLDMLHLYLPHDLYGLLDSCDVNGIDVGLIYTGGVQDPLVLQIGSAIAEELSESVQSKIGSLLVESLSIAVVTRLVQHHARPGAALRALEKSTIQFHGGLDPRRLQRVLEFVDAHAESNISLEAIAGEACLSRFHFVRAFKRSMGLTPLACVNSVRIKRAKRLMIEEQHSVEDVAALLQFSSGSNFARVFKRTVGVTPSDYRAMK